MRIISGQLKGRVFKSPPKGQVRPIQDRVKGAIFNILGDKVQGAKVLDLFSGSGSFGLEALSRGATHVTFIEDDFQLCRLIERNLANLKVADQGIVLRGSVADLLKEFGTGQEMFDLVFSDPPYGQGLAELSLRQLAEYVILTQFGFMVVETHKKEKLPETVKDLVLWDRRDYGGTTVWFYHR